MPLWIPDRHRINSSPPPFPNVCAFYSFEDVIGRKPSLTELIALLSSVPREDAIRWLCAISRGLLTDGGMTPATHCKWSEQLFPTDWTETLHARVRQDGRDASLVFHRRSVWLVLQLALLACRHEAVSLSNDEVAKRTGQACFIANDFVEAIEDTHGDIPSGTDIAEWQIGIVIPLLGIDKLRVELECIGQSKALWEDAAMTPRFLKELKNRNLDSFEARFELRYGVSLRDFLRFTTLVYVRFFANQLESHFDPMLIEPSKDEAFAAFPVEVRDAAIRLLVQTPDDLMIELLRARQSWTSDLTPIRKHPLLTISEGRYCCPDFTLLVRAAVDKTYFLLQDAYPANSFRELFGPLFEEYVFNVLEETAVSSGPTRTLLKSPSFSGTNDQAADAILDWCESAAVLEIKAGQLTTRQKSGGIRDELLKGIKSLLIGDGRNKKGIKQLADNLKRLHKGEEVASDQCKRRFESCSRYFPILVCYDHSLCIHAVRHWLQSMFDRELAERDVPRHLVTPLILLSAAELERIAAPDNRVSIQEILTRYSKYLIEQPNDITGSCWEFISRAFKDRLASRSAVSVRKHDELLKELAASIGER